MPRETDKTTVTVYNININGDITFFLLKEHFSFFPSHSRNHSRNEINTEITNIITGNRKSFDNPPFACFFTEIDGKKYQEPNTIILKCTGKYVILKHVKYKL